MTTDDTLIEYRADTLGVISALLAGYSGGITIVREMAQNADDVPGEDDRWLEFHFYPEKLIIRNNTHFRHIDFENINNIARGGKRLENRSTIGAFGVGFVSVYQLTDTPILRSSGREIQFFPATGQARQRSSTVVDYTEFELPYRRKASEVGNRLGMPPVTELWVEEIKHRLPDEAFRLPRGLRHPWRPRRLLAARTAGSARRKRCSASSTWHVPIALRRCWWPRVIAAFRTGVAARSPMTVLRS